LFGNHKDDVVIIHHLLEHLLKDGCLLRIDVIFNPND